jgi:ABC-2 type transport system permease protein
MQVFKLCLKIIYKNKPILLIYIVIFLAVSSIMSINATQDKETASSFKPAKTAIAFLNEENTPLINGFKEELAKVAYFVDIPDETEALQDALYFRQVSCILRIPKGFTEKFMNNGIAQFEKTGIPDSIKNVNIDLYIDKYFNTARLYVQNVDGITQQELVQYLKKDLSETVTVEMITGENTSNLIFSNYFFNYFAYSLLSIIILGMSTLMLIFNDRDLKMRNSCSPVSSSSISIQFALGNLTFTLLSWLIMVLLCLTLNYKNSFNLNTVFFIISSFIFAFCCSGISFLIGNLVNSRDAISAVANVVTLGMCFISGVFVPQELIGSSVLKIASFMPTYWYVKANNTIATLTSFTYDTVQPVLHDFLIIIGFGLAFFSVSLAIRKKKISN